MFVNKSFNEILKYERKSRELTQNMVAQSLGTTPRRISHLESGKIEPDIITLVNLARLFEVTTDYLLGLEN